VLTSSGTDTYSAIAAAVGSLKGPKHGGANLKVMEMLNFMKQEISDPEDENAVREYLLKILSKQAGDRSGLIYGMGHAVYTLSDPRSVILKKNITQLSAGTEIEADVRLLSTVERITPDLMAEVKGLDPKTICSNVDLYSGLVYQLLRIPPEVYTPLFATARMAGWCAHRLEELCTGGKIMRPAYKAINSRSRIYTPLSQR
jgi:citrate synthase